LDLDAWSDANVLDPLILDSEEYVDDAIVERVKKAIREKSPVCVLISGLR
jgi:asparagine synthetase B (glutamine-hydrolysing)